MAILKTCRALVLPALLAICSTGGIATAQESASQNSSAATSHSERKILRQTMPQYPDLARRMNLSGTVKVVAVVAADGTVKKVEPMGGSPVLMQAAQDAIFHWKFAPGPESREVLLLHFAPLTEQQ